MKSLYTHHISYSFYVNYYHIGMYLHMIWTPVVWNGKIIIVTCSLQALLKWLLNSHRHGQWYIKYTYIDQFKHKISSQFCCSPLKQENNMNNMEKWVVLQVTKNQEIYCLYFNNVCWTEYYQSKRLYFSSKVVFGVCYIRVFCEISGWSLLWITMILVRHFVSILLASPSIM